MKSYISQKCASCPQMIDATRPGVLCDRCRAEVRMRRKRPKANAKQNAAMHRLIAKKV